MWCKLFQMWHNTNMFESFAAFQNNQPPPPSRFLESFDLTLRPSLAFIPGDSDSVWQKRRRRRWNKYWSAIFVSTTPFNFSRASHFMVYIARSFLTPVQGLEFTLHDAFLLLCYSNLIRPLCYCLFKDFQVVVWSLCIYLWVQTTYSTCVTESIFTRATDSRPVTESMLYRNHILSGSVCINCILYTRHSVYIHSYSRPLSESTVCRLYMLSG